MRRRREGLPQRSIRAAKPLQWVRGQRFGHASAADLCSKLCRPFHPGAEQQRVLKEARSPLPAQIQRCIPCCLIIYFRL